MTRLEAGRHNLLRHRPFAMDIISTPIGRPNVTARFGITEACTASAVVGTPSELAQRAEP